MAMIKGDCIEFFENRKVCVAKENGKTYRLENNSDIKVRKIKIDGCIIHDTSKRCDYSMDFESESVKRVIFIELKGGALGDAVKQLISAVDLLKGEFKNYQMDARIVGSRDVPLIENSPGYLELARQIKRSGGNIKRATNNIFIENI